MSTRASRRDFNGMTSNDDEQHIPDSQAWVTEQQDDGTTGVFLSIPEYVEGVGRPHGGSYDTPNLANIAIRNGAARKYAVAWIAERVAQLSTHEESGGEA